VQKLTGCMAALNRFISKLGERGMPFFKLLKHQEKFVWTQRHIKLSLNSRISYPSHQLSVQNMVPTLTSRKRRGLSLNGRC
jgi:hypothetical protein